MLERSVVPVKMIAIQKALLFQSHLMLTALLDLVVHRSPCAVHHAPPQHYGPFQRQIQMSLILRRVGHMQKVHSRLGDSLTPLQSSCMQKCVMHRKFVAHVWAFHGIHTGRG